MGLWVVSTLLVAAQIGGDPSVVSGHPVDPPPVAAPPSPAPETDEKAPPTSDAADQEVREEVVEGVREQPAGSSAQQGAAQPSEPTEVGDPAASVTTGAPTSVQHRKGAAAVGQPGASPLAPAAVAAAEAAYKACLAPLDAAAEQPSETVVDEGAAPPASTALDAPELIPSGAPDDIADDAPSGAGAPASKNVEPEAPANALSPRERNGEPEAPANALSPRERVEACLQQLRVSHAGTPAAERAVAVLDAVRIMQASGARLTDAPPAKASSNDDDDDAPFVFEPPAFAGRIQLTTVSAAFGLASGIATASIGGVWLPSLPALWVLLGGGLGAALAVGYGVGGFILSGDDWGGSPGAWLGGAGLFAGLTWGGALSTMITALFASLLPQQITQQTAFQGLATTDIILTGMGGYMGFAAGFALAWLLKLDERQVNVINVTATVGGLASLLMAINWFAPATLFGSGPITLGYLTAAAAASYIVGSMAHVGVGIGLSYVLDYTVAEGVVIAAASLGSAAVVGITTNIAAPLLGLASLGSWAYVPFATFPAALAAGAGGATAAGVISFLRQASGEPVLRLDRLKDLGLDDLETFIPAPLMIRDKEMTQTMIAPVIGLRF